MRSLTSSSSSLIIAASIALTACGGGGGGGDALPSQTPDSTQDGPTPYMFYSGSLVALDPDNPASPVTIESGDVDGTALIQTGTLDATSKIVSNINTDAVMYIKDGKIYRVSSAKSQSLTPQRVSSESAAHTVCNSEMYSAIADSFKAHYFYQTGGDDNTCGTHDDQWYVVRDNDSDSTAPTAISSLPIMSLGDTNTMTSDGWLLAENGVLKTSNLDFTSETVLANFTGTAHILHTTLSKTFLNIDDKLHIYNDTTNTLSPPLHDIQNGFIVDLGTGSAESHFFADGNDIWRIKKDGSETAQAVTSLTPGSSINMLINSDQYVYISWESNLPTPRSVISRIDYATNAVTEIAEFPDESSPILINASSDYIYLSTTSGTDVIARILNSDGSIKKAAPQAIWTGIMALRGNAVNSESGYFFDTLVLAEGVANSSFGGSTLTSYDINSGNPIATLGTLPNDVLMPFGFDWSHNVLITAFAKTADGSPQPFQIDIFFANINTDSSLYRVTHTQDKNEEAIMH